MRLVLAGNHQQFADWLRLVYGPGGAQGDPPDRPVFREDQLRGLTAADIDVFHQVGTYWENAAWGSDSYHYLMAEGQALGKHWAMEWTLDWHGAQAKRIPIDPSELVAARDVLVRIERELNDGA